MGDKVDNDFAPRVEQLLEEAALQYHVLMDSLPKNRFPRYFDPRASKLETSGPDWWTSGYYAGTLLTLYQETEDPQLLKEAQRMLQLLDKQKNNKTSADIGMIVYPGFFRAMEVEPTTGRHQTLVTSAKTLAGRYDKQVGAIRSWDVEKDNFLVLIDHMMNLDLLFWATYATGDSSYYRIAEKHAETTLKNQFRDDHSSYNVVNYDPKNGAVKEYRSTQGYNKSSAWARGQAYGLYGFTVAYRETGRADFLEQAKEIADYIIGQKAMPNDLIPYWDFNDPAIPSTFRDAGAATITASALLELSEFVGKGAGKKYLRTAEDMLKSLSSPVYTANFGNNGGFLLKHSSGYVPVRMEMDMAHPYTDYYYIEALRRYKNLLK